MTLRAMGPFNGTLPEPTGILVAFLRDPSKMPYLKYVQLIPAPEVQFMWARLDPDEAVRLVNLNEYAWGYDDYRPTGKGFTVKVEWLPGRIGRWDFPYTLGNTTQRVWTKNLISPRQVYDRMRASHAALHRASRVVNALNNASWGANTSTVNTLLGTVGARFDRSSGTQYDPATGVDNPNFQVIKRTFQEVKQKIHLATNAALSGEELICVMPPVVAKAVAVSGEMVEFLKQSQFAKELTDPNIRDWNLPPAYGGFTLVVEDTPRCLISQHADGTVADVTVPSQKSYILNTDTIYFLSRPGKLDGEYGTRNYSTVQVFTLNGEGRIEAFSEPKHDLVEGHAVLEDSVQTPALISGFQVTGVLSGT